MLGKFKSRGGESLGIQGGQIEEEGSKGVGRCNKENVLGYATKTQQNKEGGLFLTQAISEPLESGSEELGDVGHLNNEVIKVSISNNEGPHKSCKGPRKETPTDSMQDYEKMMRNRGQHMWGLAFI